MKNLMNEETLHPARRYAQREWDPAAVQYVWTYAYDGRGRLTSAQETGGSHYKYTYDDGDNLLTKETWSYAGGLPMLDARDTFGYNNANEQTSMNLDGWAATTTFDAWGRMTKITDGSQNFEYGWHYGGKMVSFDSPSLTNTLKFDYGGDGKKRARYFDPPCSTDGTWYNWDAGWTIINEEAGADGTGALERTYVGKTLAHADGTNPGLGTWRYYHMDAQGSVGLVTDPSQTVKAAFAYRPYGERYASTGSEVDDITHRYAQLEWDPTVVQYYAPYRWYHPRLSRWTTRDPLGIVDGPNVYAYVMGDPVNAVDPMGLLSVYDAYWGPMGGGGGGGGGGAIILPPPGKIITGIGAGIGAAVVCVWDWVRGSKKVRPNSPPTHETIGQPGPPPPMGPTPGGAAAAICFQAAQKLPKFSVQWYGMMAGCIAMMFGYILS